MKDPKALIDQFWTLFESNQIDALAPLVDPDLHFKMPGFEGRGFVALKQLLGAYRVAFPDLRHRVKGHVASADRIALELEVTGTHTGPLQTPQGTIAPTGKSVVWESCDYVEVRQGRIASWHVYHDPMPFLTAVGLMPAPH